MWTRAWSPLWLFVLPVCLLADVLVGINCLAFRDAAHFYTPLYDFVRSQWQTGRFPLWDPYTGIGAPLVASPTAAVFYPGQLVFWLPCSAPQALGLYCLLHLALAAWGAHTLARRLGCTVAAALVAALAYSCSGSVLFQCHNVVFLVGAAWLPWAILTSREALGHNSIPAALALAVILALMVLGGDAQMAYHAALLACLYALYCILRDRRGSPYASPSTRAANGTGAKVALRRLLLLPAIAAWALALAAMQVLPSAEFSRETTRAYQGVPRNAYHLLLGSKPSDAVDSDRLDGILAKSHPDDTHLTHIYDFSLAPWQALEFIWPGSTGSIFPTNERWPKALFGEARVWVPSIYLGLLPICLALAVALRPHDGHVHLLRWLAIGTLLAALGRFGLGWLAAQVFGQTAAGGAAALPVGQGFGGVYWLLVTLLPGYDAFRYPAKWLVPSSLAIALLAAKGSDQLAITRPRRLPRILVWLSLASAALSLVLLASSVILGAATVPSAADAVFGPLDVRGAWWSAVLACWHTAAIAGSGAWLLARRWVSSGRATTVAKPERSTSRFAFALLAITTVDLAVAQYDLLGKAPREALETPSQIGTRVRVASAGPTRDARIPPRVNRAPIWRPAAWLEHLSDDRLTELVRWDRDTLWPLYHLSERIGVLTVAGTFDRNVYGAMLAAIAKPELVGLAPREMNATRALEALGAEFHVLPPEPDDPPTDDARSSSPTDGEQLDVAGVTDVALIRISPLPRSWITRQWSAVPPSHILGNPRQALEQLFVTESGAPRDLVSEPLLEIAPAQSENLAAPARGAAASDRCDITRYEPEIVEIDVNITAPGLLVLADQFAPGWSARIDRTDETSNNAEILRVNRVMRGVLLPAGESRVVFTYAPRSFVVGAVVSAAAWFVWAACWLWQLFAWLLNRQPVAPKSGA